MHDARGALRYGACSMVDNLDFDMYLVGVDPSDAISRQPFSSLGEALDYVKNDWDNEFSQSAVDVAFDVSPASAIIYRVTATIDPTTLEVA